MGRVTDRRPVLRLSLDGSARRRADTLAVEEPLEIRVDGEPFTVTMRLPGHDVELAHGLLRSEGIIAGADEVRSARYCAGTVTDEHGRHRNTYNVLDVELHTPAPGPALSSRRSLTAYGGCGLCGTTTIDAVAATLPAADTAAHRGPVLDLATLLALPDRLAAGQQVFGATGGTHAAGLFDAAGEPVVVREDVGRHNAVDKALGRALLDGLDPAGLVLVVSSRASFELVQKAATAGLGWLVAVSAPSSLAADAADRLGLTLAGFVRGRSLNIYTHPDRLASDP